MGYPASELDSTMHPASWLEPAGSVELLEERVRIDYEEAYERHQRALAEGDWSPFESGPFATIESTRLHWARWLREMTRPMTTVEDAWALEVVAKAQDALITARVATKSAEHVREQKLEWAAAVIASSALADPELVIWARWFRNVSDRWF